MQEDTTEGIRSEQEQPAPALPAARRARSDTDRTLLSRYECKYRVAPALVPDLRRYVSAFVRPDRYAAPRPGNRYTVSSLYLDSPDLQLHGMNVDGYSKRYKLRVRTYDDDPSSPAFLEIKRRHEGIVRKRRAAMSRDVVEMFLGSRVRSARGSRAPAMGAADEFARLTGEIDAEPVLRVRYLREAYESASNDPVRITFDTDVSYAVSLDGDCSVERGEWVTTPIGGQILEVKFTDLFPSWVQGLVEEFDLERDSIAKYCISVEHALRTGALGQFVPPGHEFAQ